jgi:hypothetical protein
MGQMPEAEWWKSKNNAESLTEPGNWINISLIFLIIGIIFYFGITEQIHYSIILIAVLIALAIFSLVIDYVNKSQKNYWLPLRAWSIERKYRIMFGLTILLVVLLYYVIEVFVDLFF